MEVGVEQKELIFVSKLSCSVRHRARSSECPAMCWVKGWAQFYWAWGHRSSNPLKPRFQRVTSFVGSLLRWCDLCQDLFGRSRGATFPAVGPWGRGRGDTVTSRSHPHIPCGRLHAPVDTDPWMPLRTLPSSSVWEKQECGRDESQVRLRKLGPDIVMPLSHPSTILSEP